MIKHTTLKVLTQGAHIEAPLCSLQRGYILTRIIGWQIDCPISRSEFIITFL